MVEYVDPANLVYSHTNSPYFEDIYYVGEVKNVPINELVKQFPHLEHEDLEDIVKNRSAHENKYGARDDSKDNNIVQVIYFNYKTYMNEVYKVKQTSTGGEKAIKKDDQFNPPDTMEGDYSRISRSVECLYDGAKILGTDKLLKWEMAKNMVRPKSDYTKVKMNYAIVAPRMYNGKIESLVGRITGFADMIQLTHLKLQQVLARMVPDGVYLDADGLAEIDLGNGTNYNPQEALNMFFQTGSIIGRSLTQEGDMNPGKVPIQEISGGQGAGNKMQALIGNYNYYLQMIRDVTGLNEARDGSMPEKYSLVGVQKLAAANSNTATRHILQAGLFLTAEIAECLSLRISDIIEYAPTRDAFIRGIGIHNVASLDEIRDLHLYDFGIFLELAPDEEEKMLLENNLQKLQQENMRVQAEANAQQQREAAQAEVQKQQQLAQTEIQIEQAKSQMESQKLLQETDLKKQLMELEFQYDMQLKQMEVDTAKNRDNQKEDRKDERTKIQASQQSEMIDQRSNDKPPRNFESAGNDMLSGGSDLGGFKLR